MMHDVEVLSDPVSVWKRMIKLYYQSHSESSPSTLTRDIMKQATLFILNMKNAETKSGTQSISNGISAERKEVVHEMLMEIALRKCKSPHLLFILDKFREISNNEKKGYEWIVWKNQDLNRLYSDVFDGTCHAKSTIENTSEAIIAEENASDSAETSDDSSQPSSNSQPSDGSQLSYHSQPSDNSESMENQSEPDSVIDANYTEETVEIVMDMFSFTPREARSLLRQHGGLLINVIQSLGA